MGSKLYYGIKEVAEELGVNQSKLRFWEKQFPKELQIRTSPTGRRQYTVENIEMLKTIKHLSETKGLKLTGIKETMSANKPETTRKVETLELLRRLKEDLKRLRKLVSRPDEIEEEEADNAEWSVNGRRRAEGKSMKEKKNEMEEEKSSKQPAEDVESEEEDPRQLRLF